ncbi:MAG: type IV toxin-antitoxin system AbiEi family antitoxin domain-containing protein [Bacteroidales bacterium]
MEKLEELFVQNKGYLTSKLIRGNRSLYYQLKTMLATEKVVQIKRGLYRHVDFAEEASWGEVCKIAPQAVICLFSAWRFYELSTQTSTVIHVAIPAKVKVLLPNYPPIKLYYWNKRFYETGIIETTYNEDEITIYDIEKSVCDAIRYRNKVGADITSEVLRNYLKRKDRNLDKLTKYAQNMRIATVLNQYLSMML